MNSNVMIISKVLNVSFVKHKEALLRPENHHFIALFHAVDYFAACPVIITDLPQ